MATISCKDFQDNFEPRTTGPLDPAAQAHIRGCPNCRSIAEDFTAIRSTALELGAAESEPPARVWISLRAQLVEEGIIKGGLAEDGPRKSRRGWFAELFTGWSPSLPRPALAGAYLAVLIAVAFGLSGPINSRLNRQRWLDGTQSSTTPLSADLMSAEQASFSSQPDSNSLVTASFHKNLEIVDNYITLCENSVREEPENELAREYLYEAYQQKADLLSQMSERRANAEAPAQ